MSNTTFIPIRPRRLNHGDTIGVVAPAGVVQTELFRSGIAVLQKMGFKTQVAEQTFYKKGYLAGSDRQRADTMNAFIRDPGVKAIMCARGGYGCMRILDLIDYSALQKNPKPIVGFSDVTALLMAAYVRCGLVTIHGPVVTSLAAADRYTRESLSQILSGQSAVRLTSPGGPVICPGVCEARVLAGNLTLLSHLIGTPFAAYAAGHILLLEDLNEAPYRIDRMLTHLHLAGFFKDIAGIALGTFEDCGSPEKLHHLFHDRFKDLGIPVLAGFDVGHGRRNLPVPFGLEATLDTNHKALIYKMPATQP